jgi:hypothetical protein
MDELKQVSNEDSDGISRTTIGALLSMHDKSAGASSGRI